MSSASGVPTERTGIPGYWVIFFERAVYGDPAECTAILCHRVMVGAVVFRAWDTLDTRECSLFEAYFTRLARSRTYASPGPLPSRFCPLPFMPVARFATDPPGWPDRAGFAPAR